MTPRPRRVTSSETAPCLPSTVHWRNSQVIITILVAAANANATAGGCYTAIAKTEFTLRLPHHRRRARVAAAAAAPPPRRHGQKNTAMDG